MKEHFHFDRLKAAVKDLAEKGRFVQGNISELRRQRPAPDPQAHGDRIHAAVLEKRGFGYCSRYHQLAWAFVRGVPYARVEPRTRMNRVTLPDPTGGVRHVDVPSKPSAHIIFDVLCDFAKEPLVPRHVHALVNQQGAEKAYLWLELVKHWLAGVPAPATKCAA